MEKILKSRIFIFVLGFVVATAISVYAISASEIIYNNTTVDQALDDLYDMVLPTNLELLWTNPNPSSAFASQTLNLDLSDYKYVVISSTYGGNGILNDYSTTNKSIIEVGTTGTITGVYHSYDGGAATVRKAVVSESSILFGDGKWYNGQNQVSSNYAVPLYIWGIK